MNHLGFIVAAYACGVIVVSGLVLWVAIEHRRLKKRLAEAERLGGRGN